MASNGKRVLIKQCTLWHIIGESRNVARGIDASCRNLSNTIIHDPHVFALRFCHTYKRTRSRGTIERRPEVPRAIGMIKAFAVYPARKQSIEVRLGNVADA
jgi:hypothetical protein